MATTQSAVKNELITTIENAFTDWDKINADLNGKGEQKFNINIDDQVYTIANKPEKLRNKKGEIIYRVDLGDQKKILKADHVVEYIPNKQKIETPKKQQLIVDENDISVSFLETLARQLSPYEVLQLSQKLLAIAMENMTDPGTNKPEKTSVSASSNGNGKKIEKTAIATTSTNGKKPENKTTDARGRKSSDKKLYANYWDQFTGYGSCHSKKMPVEEIAAKYGVGVETVREELSTYNWLKELGKNEKTKASYLQIVKGWKDGKITFFQINRPIKTRVNKIDPDLAIKMALGEVRMSDDEIRALKGK